MIVKTNRRQVVLTGLSAAVLSLSAPHVARAAVRVIKLGNNSVPTSQYGAGSIALAEAAAVHPDLTGVKIEVRGNAELGDELPMLTDCRRSVLDMMVCSSLVATGFCPEAGLLDAPFVFTSVDRARAALDREIGEEFSALLKAKDINVMAWAENGMRHITSNRLVRTPEDLIGLKIRVPPSEIVLDAFKSMGADAKPLAFNQLPEALRTGQFDAQENPIASIESAKLQTWQKYLCLSGHIYSAGFFVASPDLLEDLTPTQTAALKACARVGAAKSREIAASGQRDGIGRLKAAGMTVIDDVDVAAFARASKASKDRLAAKYGADRLQRLVSAGA